MNHFIIEHPAWVRHKSTIGPNNPNLNFNLISFVIKTIVFPHINSKVVLYAGICFKIIRWLTFHLEKTNFGVNIKCIWSQSFTCLETLIRPRLHRARGFSRRGLDLFLIFYKSSIFFIKPRVKQSSSWYSRELFKIKSGYTAVFTTILL